MREKEGVLGRWRRRRRKRREETEKGGRGTVDQAAQTRAREKDKAFHQRREARFDQREVWSRQEDGGGVVGWREWKKWG